MSEEKYNKHRCVSYPIHSSSSKKTSRKMSLCTCNIVLIGLSNAIELYA